MPVQLTPAPDRISLLRLDTDWYESTYHELVHLYPRLSVGGVLIIDDYGHWAGARKAVDQYIDEHQLKLLLHRIDYTARVGVKLEPRKKVALASALSMADCIQNPRRRLSCRRHRRRRLLSTHSRRI